MAYDRETDTYMLDSELKEFQKQKKKRLAVSPCDVRSARKKSGFTMEEAAAFVFVSRRTWESWEKETDHYDYRKMHPAFAELFALKTGLKPLPEILTKLKEKWWIGLKEIIALKASIQIGGPLERTMMKVRLIGGGWERGAYFVIHGLIKQLGVAPQSKMAI